MQKEIWKTVDGYNGLYEVSDLGRVRSKHSGEWKVLRATINNKGYFYIDLSKDNKRKRFYVHRLVADAFIANDDSSKTIINHINEVKTDNRVSNLEWCTVSYNLSYNELRYRSKRPQHYNCKRSKIKELYDPNLSIPKNLEIFKANGIECCGRTVRNIRNDLGLTKHYRPRSNQLNRIRDKTVSYFFLF